MRGGPRDRQARGAARRRGRPARSLFAVCGGYQLLGHAYELDGERLPGVGLVDLETVREDGPRLIGNVAIELDLPRPLDAPASRAAPGFENHGGRTRLGRPSGRSGACSRGMATTARDGFEGVRGGPAGNVVGTYLHGPLLPKNTWFADWLVAMATGLDVEELVPLDDAFEHAAHLAARRAAGV